MAEWGTPIADFPAEFSFQWVFDPEPGFGAFFQRAAVQQGVGQVLPVRMGGLSCDYVLVGAVFEADHAVLSLQRQGEPYAD